MSDTAKIYTDAEIDSLDILAEVRTVNVRPADFREGMVLVDDLGTPVALLDHRMPAVRNSGAARWMIADLVEGGWSTHSFHRNVSFAMVAL